MIRSATCALACKYDLLIHLLSLLAYVTSSSTCIAWQTPHPGVHAMRCSLAVPRPVWFQTLSTQPLFRDALQFQLLQDVSTVYGFSINILLGAGGFRKKKFWTSRVNPFKNNIFHLERVGGGGWLGGVQSLGPLLQKCSGRLPQNFKRIFGFLSSITVDWHPLSANW
eukprot:528313-Pelagomonas_calceolata.AAC.1